MNSMQARGCNHETQPVCLAPYLWTHHHAGFETQRARRLNTQQSLSISLRCCQLDCVLKQNFIYPFILWGHAINKHSKNIRRLRSSKGQLEGQCLLSTQMIAHRNAVSRQPGADSRAPPSPAFLAVRLESKSGLEVLQLTASWRGVL